MSEVTEKLVHSLKWDEQDPDLFDVSRCSLQYVDNGGEYKSSRMAKICDDQGIIQQFSPPHHTYTLQLNGAARCMNRKQLSSECARCMLDRAKFPKPY